MEPYSDYEIARRRVQQQEDRKAGFQLSTVMFLMMLFVTLFSDATTNCAMPLMIIFGVAAATTGIDFYYSMPEHAPSNAEIEQQMAWLFGDQWQDEADANAYDTADSRIHRRRLVKWAFVVHLLFFIPINGLIASSSKTAVYSDSVLFVAIALIWLFLIIAHVFYAFPTKRQLERREKIFGKDFRFVLTHRRSINDRMIARMKQGTYYMVDGDGEFVEVEADLVDRNSL